MTDRLKVKNEVIKMWNEGYTSGDIAWTLKVTRNSIMGTIHRAQKVGLAIKKDPYHPPKPKIVKEEPVKKPVAVKPKVVKKVVAKPKKKPNVNYKTLMELGPHDCRWVVGEGYFCGAYSESQQRPWCEQHHKIVYVPSKPSDRKKGRDPIKAKFIFSGYH